MCLNPRVHGFGVLVIALSELTMPQALTVSSDEVIGRIIALVKRFECSLY